ncbi:MAG: hypothetical protein ABFE16_04060 [Armatimonadia bacterium]
MATTLLTSEPIGTRDQAIISASGVLNLVNDTFGDTIPLDPIQYVSVQAVGAFTGTLTFEVSDDKVTWIAKTLTSPAGVSASTMTVPGMFSGDMGARYFRVKATALSAGTPTVYIYGSSESQSSSIVSISGTPTVNLGTGGTGATALGKAEDAVAASGDTGVGILGVRIPTTPASPTSAAGDYGHLAIDLEGKQVISGTGGPETYWDANVAFTTTSDVALIAAAAAGIRRFIKTLILENTGAAVARFLLRDGTTTKATFTIPANSTLVVNFDQPWRGTAATVVNGQLGAAGTVTVTALGFLGV